MADFHKPLYTDFGQIHYLVDSDFRTAQQGWSRADRTGPLDLYAARQSATGGVQYVFRTGDFASDAATIQAGIDAAIDFRGDTIMFTNGQYTPTTAVTIDVADLRLLGRPVAHPNQCGATITCGVASALTFAAAADRVELGFLRIVPITAAAGVTIAAASDAHYWHDFFMDAAGVATSATTVPISLVGTSNNSVFTSFRYVTDTQHAAMIVTTLDPGTLTISDFSHYHIAAGAGALAISILDATLATTAAAERIVIRKGRGYALAGGTVTALSKLGNNGTNTVNVVIEDFIGSVGYSTATGLNNNGGAAAEANLINCWLGTDEATAGAAAVTGYVLYTS